MIAYADCTYCGGHVDEKQVTYDYRRRDRLIVFDNVPAGVCRQCGEKYFRADVAKRMDDAYHDVVDRRKPPQGILQVPWVSL